MRADRNLLRIEVRRALGTGEDRLWDGILVTPRVRSVVRLAEEHTEAGLSIEPIALFEAILAEGGGIGRGTLAPLVRKLTGHTQVAG